MSGSSLVTGHRRENKADKHVCVELTFQWGSQTTTIVMHTHLTRISRMKKNTGRGQKRQGFLYNFSPTMYLCRGMNKME